MIENEEPFAAAFLKVRRRARWGRRLRVLCVLLAIVWLRSMLYADGVEWQGRQQQLSVGVGAGQIHLVANDKQMLRDKWQYTANQRVRTSPRFGFSWDHTSSPRLAVPLWALAATAGLTGIYFSRRSRGSLLFA